MHVRNGVTLVWGSLSLTPIRTWGLDGGGLLLEGEYIFVNLWYIQSSINGIRTLIEKSIHALTCTLF